MPPAQVLPHRPHRLVLVVAALVVAALAPLEAPSQRHATLVAEDAHLQATVPLHRQATLVVAPFERLSGDAEPASWSRPRPQWPRRGNLFLEEPRFEDSSQTFTHVTDT